LQLICEIAKEFFFFPNEPRQCDVIKAMLRFKNRRMETKKAKNWLLGFFLLYDVLFLLSLFMYTMHGKQISFNIFYFFQSSLPQLARFIFCAQVQ
jgi:hypothetical protein